ncbi:hypothetical protein A3840_08750 [Devosia elaeis]|uniref:Uncharacterized protein n=2 Tax=Devosia elaeis TaxID=1770058 RepID=A0A178HZ15_9HYPH|nr:hypothetical protein A3840_08750 [Devosia elaeis]
MGGSDDPANLVKLTPEDHFFAHLLLAKAYGGKQWFSVIRMGASRVDGKRSWVRQRYMYGAARRRACADISARFTGAPGRRGADNGMYDGTLYTWTNVDTGETALATKGEMWEIVGGCRAHWTSVVTGERKTMLGWTVYPDLVRVRSSKGKTFEFANDNGETFVGTQKQFASYLGISVASASRIARGMQIGVNGWRTANAA